MDGLLAEQLARVMSGGGGSMQKTEILRLLVASKSILFRHPHIFCLELLETKCVVIYSHCCCVNPCFHGFTVLIAKLLERFAQVATMLYCAQLFSQSSIL